MQIKCLLFLFFFAHYSFVLGQAGAGSLRTPRQGKDRALFFAVNTYDNMTNLRNPIQNSQDIAKELEDNYDFLTEVVPNPSLEQIEEKIAEYRLQYQKGYFAKDGQLLIFFTGHGKKKGNNGYFMPKDAQPNRPHVSAIEYDYWRDEINNIDCQHILVAVDACHSAFFDPNWRLTKSNNDFIRPGEKFADKVLLNHKDYRARLFFTSDGEGNETPDRSNFAKQFLLGLRTHSSSTNYLTSSELFGSYLKKAFPPPSGGDFGRDDPGSNFLFFRKIKKYEKYSRLDLKDWKNAQITNTINAYRDYLNKHLNGDFRQIAEEKIKSLEEQEWEDWEKTKRENTVQAYFNFMKKHPDSEYTKVAVIRERKLRDKRQANDKMIFIKGGSFQMGSEEKSDQKPIHKVALNAFYIAKHEVTVAEYLTFANTINAHYPEWLEKNSKYNIKTGSDPYYKKYGNRLTNDNNPIVGITWYDAIAYCNWLSKEHNLLPVYTISGNNITVNWEAEGYRLPTEAEWEYAARSRGKNEKWSGTSTEVKLTLYANSRGNSDSYGFTSPIGSFGSNELGLFDMSGNVWEWCWDWYDRSYYKTSTNNNPKGNEMGHEKVFRGGSWLDLPAGLLCTNRDSLIPNDSRSYIGFRLCKGIK